ncbi:MAG: hypothetical protein WCG66_08565 [bacterium]
MKNRHTLTPALFGSLIAITLLMAISDVHAFGGPVGGPFSNGSYFPTEGTFSAVVRGENLSGTIQFSTSTGSGSSSSGSGNSTSAGGAGSTGVATIYYDGDTYLGNSQGALNPQSSTMTVNFQADVQGQGQNTISVQKQVTDTTTSNGTTTTTTTTIPYRQVSYFDSLYLNGYADCKTSNAFPNQKFQGSGQAEFQHLVFTGNTPFLDAVDIPISVTGVRLSDTASNFATQDVQPPSVNEFSVLVQ